MNRDDELLRCLCRAAAMSKRKPATEDDSPPPPRAKGHGHILSVLNESNGQSQQELADSLGIRAQSLSEALETLEARGFVIRRTDGNDKRKTLVYITEAGSEHSRLLEAERAERAARLLGPLTAEERQTLLSLLKKLTATDER